MKGECLVLEGLIGELMVVVFVKWVVWGDFRDGIFIDNLDELFEELWDWVVIWIVVGFFWLLDIVLEWEYCVWSVMSS